MSPDSEKIRQKVQFIRDALRLLERIREGGQDAFSDDAIAQAAAVRGLQVAIEAVLDAANHIIAREGLGLPKTYPESVELLASHDILPRDKLPAFVRMVGFRNRAVHLYDEMEPDQVFRILEQDLGDFEIFIGAMAERYLEP